MMAFSIEHRAQHVCPTGIAVALEQFLNYTGVARIGRLTNHRHECPPQR
jgi:hypothetical protein